MGERMDGQQLRDDGAKRALDSAGGDWHSDAVKIALAYLKDIGYKGALFEEVRIRAERNGFPEPPSPNAWGAVCLHMSKLKLIEKTGEYRSSRSVRSHARAQPVWRSK
jgi:hypothetical protein